MFASREAKNVIERHFVKYSKKNPFYYKVEMT